MGRSLPPIARVAEFAAIELAALDNQVVSASGPGLAPLFANPLAPERDLVENVDVFHAPCVGVHHAPGRIRRVGCQPLPGGEL